MVISIATYGCESWPNISKHIRIISRMSTRHKRLISNNKDDEFKSLWDKENQELLSNIKIRKLKYIHNILNKKGCNKLSELLDKNRNNPFFDFINNTNYKYYKKDAENMNINIFVKKYKNK